MCICLCSGTIPPDYATRYKDLYLRQVLNKDKRSGANDKLDGAICDLQESAVSAITPVDPSPWCELFLLFFLSPSHVLAYNNDIIVLLLTQERLLPSSTCRNQRERER